VEVKWRECLDKSSVAFMEVWYWERCDLLRLLRDRFGVGEFGWNELIICGNGIHQRWSEFTWIRFNEGR